MTTATQPQTLETEPQSPRMSWRVWPLADRRRWSWLVPVGLIGIASLVTQVTGGVFSGVLAAVVLAISMWKFFVPVRYHLGTDGVTEFCFGRQRQLAWRQVRSYSIKQNGVVLFGVSRPVPLDAFGAFYLPWKDHRREVLRSVRRHLGENE